MRVLITTLIACTFACTSTPIGTTATTGPTASAEPAAATIDPADRGCAERAMTRLMQAMNDADAPTLKLLLGSASAGISEHAAMYPEETVARLIARNRDGERWTLVQLDVNGRGGAGGVNFGVRFQRSINGRVIVSEGKGAIDCPGGNFLIFYAT